MNSPTTIVLYSEKGGVGKTFEVAHIAAAAARDGHTVTAVDMDPRATLTEITGAQFTPGYSTDAILAADDPAGWAAELRVPSAWFPNLYVLPAERSLGNREKSPADHAEHRLTQACAGLDTDVLLVDTPPRPGGVLILSALALPGAHVLFAATPDQDGLDGVAQGWKTCEAAQRYTNRDLAALGIAVTRVDERTVDARRCIAEMASIYGDLVLTPYWPERVIVREARAACDWVGNYERGADIAAIADKLWAAVRDRRGIRFDHALTTGGDHG